MTDPLPRKRPDLAARLHDVPHQPGVYLMRDRLGRIIYVGKARDLRRRLSNYFTPSGKTKADVKTRALIDSIWDFEIQTVHSEPEAVLLEGKLIKEYRPKYNVTFRDDKRFMLARIRLEDPFPRFQLTRVKKNDGARYFGPYGNSSALRATLKWLNRELGLRTCRPANPTETDYKHCSDDIIRNCTAPCVGKISREEYLKRVGEACAVLEGRSAGKIKALEEEMLRLAGRRQFERAAELRDMLDGLRKTTRPMRRFERRRGKLGSHIDPAADVAELAEALSLDRPPAVMECFDISNISDTYSVASMVRFRDGLPDNANYRRYRVRTVTGQDDFASMAEVVRRRYARVLLELRDLAGDGIEDSQEGTLELVRRIEEELAAETGKRRAPFVRLPDLVIVDGGKGQLSSAFGQLRKLGLRELPVIGLAKEREEIFRPGQSAPIVLPHETGALRLLQRIRDEAHRFANTYHQLLLKRRIAESVLDDCPGVSENRKLALLKRFGSVKRLRKAGADDIAAVPGVGKALAAQIVDHLRKK